MPDCFARDCLFSPKPNDTLTFRSAEVQISIVACATMTAYTFGTE